MVVAVARQARYLNAAPSCNDEDQQGFGGSGLGCWVCSSVERQYLEDGLQS